jgi:energy-converting hydrogenase A subunit P
VDGKLVVDHLNCISCGECIGVCPVNGAMKGVFVENLQGQKDLILLCVNYLEDYINDKEEDLRTLETDDLLQYEVPISEIWDDALKIIPDNEIALEIMSNAVNRLKIRIIDWDKSNCKKCQLCIPDCPTDCISFDEAQDTIVRDKNRCLRCSICYQTCPFSVIKYFIAKFSMEDDEIIHATVKASNLNEDIFME